MTTRLCRHRGLIIFLAAGATVVIQSDGVPFAEKKPAVQGRNTALPGHNAMAT